MDATEKPEKLNTPSVAIDGNRIRHIRETKKLTQLYVASVVGVTTDTISRWENNRYPSIKRDNAQKLADALEVPLVEILREEQAPPAETAASAPASSPYHVKRSLLALAILAALLLFVTVLFFAPGPADPVAVRWAPRFAAPGEVFPVQVKVTRQPGHPFGFILKEKLPAGMRLVSSVPAGSTADSSGSGIKWLVPGGAAPVTISYSVRTAPAGGGNEAHLKGEVVLYLEESNRTEPVGGSSEIRIGPYHWADSNGDGRIDDDEIMPAYYVCEEMKGLSLDWKTIEAIWTGRGYRWDQKSGYTVLN